MVVRASFSTSGTVDVTKTMTDLAETFWYSLGPVQQGHVQLFVHTSSEHEQNPLSKRLEQERLKAGKKMKRAH